MLLWLLNKHQIKMKFNSIEIEYVKKDMNFCLLLETIVKI